MDTEREMLKMALFVYCVRCGKKKLALTLNGDGICPSCQTEINQAQEKDRLQLIHDAQKHYEQLRATFEIANNTGTPNILSDVHRAIAAFRDYIDLDAKTCDYPSFADFMTEIRKKRGASFIADDFAGLGKTLPEIREKVQGALESALEIAETSQAFAETLSNIPRVSCDFSPLTRGLVRSETTFMHKKLSPTNLTIRTPHSAVSDFYCIDVETTELDPHTDEIIQLAAIHFIDFRPTKCFSTYAKPKHGISPRAFEINHISEEMLIDAPQIDAAVAAFDRFLSGCKTLVGHNLPFDTEFLYWANSWASAKRNYDTLQLSRKTYEFRQIPNYKLDTLCFNILHTVRDDKHDALSDCMATGLLFKDICRWKGLIF